MRPAKFIGMQILMAWILSSIASAIAFPDGFFYLLFGLLIVVFNLISSCILGFAQFALIRFRITNPIVFLLAYVIIGVGESMILKVYWILGAILAILRTSFDW